MARNNQIWIELDEPRPEYPGEATPEDIAFNQRQCELANMMLTRLGVNESTRFWYDEKDHAYCYGGDLGYRQLSSNGAWFHLTTWPG